MSHDPYEALFRRFELNWSSDAIRFLCKVKQSPFFNLYTTLVKFRQVTQNTSLKVNSKNMRKAHRDTSKRKKQ